MLVLLSSSASMIIAGGPQQLVPAHAVHSSVSPRAGYMFLSHKQKPKRYSDPAPPLQRDNGVADGAYIPASSHTKTKSKWRHTETQMAAAGVPALQTNRLPTPREGQRIPNGRYPALVLNADYRPLSYVPLSLWSWQDTVRAVFRDAVTVLAEYDVSVSSPSLSMQLPSVIVLKRYVGRTNRGTPCFTRRNLFLRDRFCCQYCNTQLPMNALTYDHVWPRARGGGTTWENVVTACSKCNLKKAARPLDAIHDMRLRTTPKEPTWPELHSKAKAFPPKDMHAAWADYVL